LTLMHAFRDDLTNEENLRICAERVRLMRAIADRIDGESMALQVRQPIGKEPTFEFWFRGSLIHEAEGEAELCRLVMELTAEISDLFAQFQQRHDTTQDVCTHIVTAKKMVTTAWLEKAASLVNNCLDASSVDGNIGGAFAQFGDRICWVPDSAKTVSSA